MLTMMCGKYFVVSALKIGGFSSDVIQIGDFFGAMSDILYTRSTAYICQLS